MIAHELQHVVETATRGRLDRGRDMIDTFERLDRNQSHGPAAYETDAALVVQARVLAELLAKNAYAK